MSENLYDEFGNYIGPDLDEDHSEDEDQMDDEEREEEEWDRDRDEIHTGAADNQHAAAASSDDTRMITAADAAAESQVVLHEDKKYYPSAEEVYGNDVEIVVAEEDTQALETPIISSGKSKVFASVEASIPQTTFDYQFLAGMMDHPTFIRNVSFAGHLHHGKTSLIDLLVHSTHPTLRIPTNKEKMLKYTDTRFDEQERGLSIKSQPMSFIAQDLRGKSILLNTIDTPGHVNFSDEQTAAFRLTDGVVVVIDAVEGVMIQTERTIRAAVQDGLQIMLVINKVDRLILELKLPPQDAYHKLVHTIDEVNAILEKLDYFSPITNSTAAAAAASSSNTSAAAAAASSSTSSTTTTRQRLSPELNNVCFASSLHGWIFSTYSFARIYSDYHSRGKSSFAYTDLAKRLWGNSYLHSDQKFRAKPESPTNSRAFLAFILEPLYKIYSYVLGNEGQELSDLLRTELGIKLSKNELLMDSRPLLRRVCSAFFGNSTEALVDMIKNHTLNPVDNAANKIMHSYTGDITASSTLSQDLLHCNPKGHLMINICSNIPRPDGSMFDNYGRVLSGTVRVGDRVRILGESYSHEDEEDSSVTEITKIWVLQGRYRIEVNRVQAGNLALFEGLDNGITKTATVTSIPDSSNNAVKPSIFRPLQYGTLSCFKVALEPYNPSELPRMLSGLRKLDKAFLIAQTKVEESGEHILLGTGELQMDIMLHDLRRMYGYGSINQSNGGAAASSTSTGSSAPLGTEIEIKISDPQVKFSETLTETSSLKCYAETPNKKNKVTMIAEPLEQGIAEDIERGLVRIEGGGASSFASDAKARSSHIQTFFQKKYGWDLLSSRSIWSFGPDSSNGPNLLVDHTLPSEVDRKKLWSIKESLVQGFQWATREGPLCDEPIRNVKFKLLSAEISDDPILRARGQLIPTARRVCYSSFLLGTPRLMEPVYFVEIQSPADCVSAIYNVLQRRRGHVTSSIPKPGTPLYTVHAYIPLIESFGFETDLRTHTQGLAFCLSVFDHWQIVPGDPLDKSIVLRPLEPAPLDALAREFMIKTRRRKGLAEDVSITKFFDQSMIDEMATKELQDMKL